MILDTLYRPNPKSIHICNSHKQTLKAKIAKEYVFPSLFEKLSDLFGQSPVANKVSYVMRGKVVNLNISTFNKWCSKLIARSFETLTTHTLGR